MSIDLRTLILALCIIYFLQSFVFFFQFLYNRKYNSIGYWSIGSALIALGFLFFLLRDIPSLELMRLLARRWGLIKMQSMISDNSGLCMTSGK